MDKSKMKPAGPLKGATGADANKTAGTPPPGMAVSRPGEAAAKPVGKATDKS